MKKDIVERTYSDTAVNYIVCFTVSEGVLLYIPVTVNRTTDDGREYSESELDQLAWAKSEQEYQRLKAPEPLKNVISHEANTPDQGSVIEEIEHPND